MKTLAKANGLIWMFRHQPLTIRLLTATGALLTAAAAFATPAQASPIDDAFIGALNNAGVNYGSAGDAVAMGQSICPLLERPGGNLAAAFERVQGNGMSPEMARMFTTIAIQMYCPSMMANLASGNLGGLPAIPGIPGI